MGNIRAVAKKAGVSVATVSRVLNHPETVSESTKKNVLSVMEQLNYTPNSLARGLALNKTNTIALLIPNILNPKHMEIAKGVEDVAHKKGYNTLLCNTEGKKDKESEYISILVNKKVDGIIFSNCLLSDVDINGLINQKVPLVIIGKKSKKTIVNAIYTDYFSGAYEAIKHLIEVGYKDIALISGPKWQDENIDKLKGYKKALEESNIEVNKKYIIEGDNDIDGGYLAAKKLMSMSQPPQAIFATNDLMAIAALDAARDLDKKVPEDVAVIGFDNISMSSLVAPKLTTVAQPMYKMGLLAARLLFDNIESNDNDYVPQSIFLDTKLKIRESCGYGRRVKQIFD